MKLLPVADAFLTILRTTHPERVDLQKINSYRWFHDRQRVMIGSDLIYDQMDAPAYAALDLLKAGVKGKTIRLRGVLKNALPADIDPIDASEGELDVFAGTLKIYEGKATFRTARIYTSVHCYADNLLPIPKGKGGRKPVMDQNAVAAEVQRLMDHHGEFRTDDPEWNAEERLKEAIRAKFGEVAPSTIEKYIKTPLLQWRQSKQPSPKT